jgi:hypothetical protein
MRTQAHRIVDTDPKRGNVVVRVTGTRHDEPTYQVRQSLPNTQEIPGHDHHTNRVRETGSGSHGPILRSFWRRPWPGVTTSRGCPRSRSPQAQIGEYLVPVDPTAARRMQGDITVGVRPEAWRLVSPSEGGLPVRVTVVEELGSDEFVYGISGVSGTPNNIIVRLRDRGSVRKGDTIHVTTDPHRVHVFDTASGERLSD